MLLTSIPMPMCRGMLMALRIKDLTVVYNAEGGPVPALGPLSLQVESGAFIAILGPSGCGKSTLVRTLAGLHRPTSGAIQWPLATPDEGVLSVSLMFQAHNLLPWRTVLDNIALPLELTGHPVANRTEAARRWVSMLGLETFEKSYPSELSGGMAQRVALGRALITEPRWLLLDEPFGALDVFTREALGFELLRLWRAYQPTVLMVTHDIHEAVMLADRVLVLSKRPGRIVGDMLIPFERPRHPDLAYTPEFSSQVKAIRDLIDAE